jgi:SWI/SNF-related matrix-associated actin-dependent regulator of chromatin subfamily B protein 1
VLELDIQYDNVILKDRFEWDINEPLNSPEEFAWDLCEELQLSSEFCVKIAHQIR